MASKSAVTFTTKDDAYAEALTLLNKDRAARAQRELVIAATDATARIFAQDEIREICEQNRPKVSRLKPYEED